MTWWGRCYGVEAWRPRHDPSASAAPARPARRTGLAAPRGSHGRRRGAAVRAAWRDELNDAAPRPRGPTPLALVPRRRSGSSPALGDLLPTSPARSVAALDDGRRRRARRRPLPRCPLALLGRRASRSIVPVPAERRRGRRRRTRSNGRGWRLGIGVSRLTLLAVVGLLAPRPRRLRPTRRRSTKLRAAGGVLGALVAALRSRAGLGPCRRRHRARRARSSLGALLMVGRRAAPTSATASSVGARFVGQQRRRALDDGQRATEPRRRDRRPAHEAEHRSTAPPTWPAAANRRPRSSTSRSTRKRKTKRSTKKKRRTRSTKPTRTRNTRKRKRTKTTRSDEDEEEERGRRSRPTRSSELAIDLSARSAARTPGVEAAARQRPEAAASRARSTSGSSSRAARCSRRRCASSASTPASSARPSARPSPATSSSSRPA